MSYEQKITTSRSALIIEDHPINLLVCQKFLEKLGFACRSAENGAIGLEIFGQQTFDVVLMDCQMPVMDGYEATQAIRAHSDALKAKTPIIGVTASYRPADEERCLALGMNAYMGKPLVFDDLAALLDVLVR